MRDTSVGGCAVVLGVEDLTLAGPIAGWGFRVAPVESPGVAAVVASTLCGAAVAWERGLPFVLDASVDASDEVLEALGASGWSFTGADDLRRRLNLMGERRWAPVAPPPTVIACAERLVELRRWISRLRDEEVSARLLHADHMAEVERDRRALEQHRDLLLRRVEELSSAHDALAARLTRIESHPAWRTAKALWRAWLALRSAISRRGTCS